jgi:hypothetical protein
LVRGIIVEIPLDANWNVGDKMPRDNILPLIDPDIKIRGLEIETAILPLFRNWKQAFVVLPLFPWDKAVVKQPGK